MSECELDANLNPKPTPTPTELAPFGLCGWDGDKNPIRYMELLPEIQELISRAVLDEELVVAAKRLADAVTSHPDAEKNCSHCLNLANFFLAKVKR